MLFCVCMFLCLKIPYQVAFKIAVQTFIADYTLDAVLIVDVYFGMNKFIVAEGGKYITERGELRARYIGENKFLVFASVPWDLLALVVAGSSVMGEGMGYMAMCWLRGFKLFRCLKVGVYSNSVDRILEKLRIGGGGTGWKLFKLLLTVFLVAHWAACFFFLIAKGGFDKKFADGDEDVGEEELLGKCDWLISSSNSCYGEGDFNFADWGSDVANKCQWEGTWLQLQLEDDKLPCGEVNNFSYYLRALNWALPSLVVVVIGDVVPSSSKETLYCLLWLLVGVTINASIVGNIAR